MGIEQVQINGALVWRDQSKPWKVYGAIGEKARSWALRPGLPCDDTTGDPTEFAVTVTEAGAGGDSTIAVGTADGYPLLLTTDNAAYDGINAQLRGESAVLAAGNFVAIRTKVKISEDNTSDFLFGLCELKTDLMRTGTAHGVQTSNVEGVFFVKVSGGTGVLLKAYKDGAEVASVAVGVLTEEDREFALLWDGAKIHAYVDDVEVAEFAGTLPDGVLTPSINFRTGATTAITASFAELAYVSVAA